MQHLLKVRDVLLHNYTSFTFNDDFFCNLFTISFIVKIPNPLVKDLKLTYSYEDFELKKLLFNVIGVLSKDPCAVEVSCNRTEDTVGKKKKGAKESQEYYLAVHLA